MERHPRSRAKRFSDSALRALVLGVRRRRDILFPPGGKKASMLKSRRVWKEISRAVTATSVVPRTPTQCRKKFNDLTRLVKGKVADDREEKQQTGGDQTRIENLTELEDSVYQIIEGAGTDAMENGELESIADDDDTQELPATVPELKEDTVGGGEEEAEEELDDKKALRLILVDASSESGTARTLEGSTEAGSARGESPGTSGLQPGQGERVTQVSAPQRASSRTNSAPQDSDDDLDGAAFRKRVLGMHTEMLGAMASLPKSLSAVSKSMEESGSNIAQGFAQSLEPMISGMEVMGSSMRGLVDPTMVVDVMGDLAASIAAQAAATQRLTAAVEAQTAAIVAGFTNVKRGLQGVAAGQQSVLQQIAEFSEGCRAGRGC